MPTQLYLGEKVLHKLMFSQCGYPIAETRIAVVFVNDFLFKTVLYFTLTYTQHTHTHTHTIGYGVLARQGHLPSSAHLQSGDSPLSCLHLHADSLWSIARCRRLRRRHLSSPGGRQNSQSSVTHTACHLVDSASRVQQTWAEG